MKIHLLIFLALILAGCTVVPAGTAHSACNLLDIAVSEAEMAEAWYLDAGQVLKACGVPDAEATAAHKACHARRVNDNTIDCEAPDVRTD